MMNISATYDGTKDIMMVFLPNATITIDRSNKILKTSEERSEGVVVESRRDVSNVMLIDLVNMIANELKEYAK